MTLRDLRRGEIIGVLPIGVDGFVRSLEFSPDGDLMAVVLDTLDGRLRLEVWDVGSSSQLSAYDFEDPDEAITNAMRPESRLAWSADARSVFVTLPAGTVTVDVATGAATPSLPGGLAITVLPDGKGVAVLEATRVSLWDDATLELRGQVPAELPAGPIAFASASLAAGPEGTLLVITDHVEAWDPVTLQRVPMDIDPVYDMVVSPDGRLAVVDGDLWDLTRTAPISVLQFGDNSISFGTAGAFTADNSSYLAPIGTSSAGRPTSLGSPPRPVPARSLSAPSPPSSTRSSPGRTAG